jgi:capsular polysaccharide biosynthesis protein
MRWRRRPDVLAGLATAILVMLAGLWFWQTNPTEYRASTTLLVLPDPRGAGELPDYYDLLSQGQIVETFAQIMDLRVAERPPTGADATIDVTVVPDTSLVQVTATSSDAQSAEVAADAVLDQVRPFLAVLNSPYTISVIRPASGTAQQAGVPPRTLLPAILLVALIAGLAAQQAARALGRPRGGGDEPLGNDRGAPPFSGAPAGALGPTNGPVPRQSGT